MAKKLWSIFEDGELDTCIVTGRTDHIERHHIFGGRMGLKAKSEKYGFIAPLHASVHPNGAFCTDRDWKKIDHTLKRACQEYYMEHYGTREQWYQEFGKFYDYDLKECEDEAED